MHLKFAYANIQSKVLFPHGFSPYSVLYRHMCPNILAALIFELTETTAFSQQRAKKISAQMSYSDIPHRDRLSAIYTSHPQIQLKAMRNFPNY